MTDDLSDLQKRLLDVVQRTPDADIRTVLEDLSKVDPVIWCMYKRRLRGHPLVFDYSKLLTPQAIEAMRKKEGKKADQELKTRLLRHRPFLMQPMRDQHPHKVYLKARQIGISELSISEVMQFLDANPGTKWVYTFPRDTQLKDFSNTRIREAFNETPRMRQLITGTDQVMAKKVGGGHLILRSAWESNLGEGIDADGVTLDEKDRMKNGVEIAFWESLSSSRFGYKREVSTPTVPKRGVDATYQLSDQHVWLVRCERCNHEQEVKWPDNIRETMYIRPGTKELPAGAYEYCCRKDKCRGPLNRLQGRWVAKFPSVKNIRGYHLPQTIAPWITATALMQKKIDYRFLQLWINYCLGLAAKDDTALISEAALQRVSIRSWTALQTRRTPDFDKYAAGIDWGNLNWCVVYGRNVHNGRWYIVGILWVEDDPREELASTKAIGDYLEAFDPDCIVGDAGYGKDRMTYLLRRFGRDESGQSLGKVWACWYNSSSKASRSFQPTWSHPEQAKLSIDRTISLKELCRAIKEMEFGMPSEELEAVKLLHEHILALTPMKEEDEDGDIIETITASGDDHLAHAALYGYIALDHACKAGRFNFDFLG
jgi:hypothetical protein